MEKLSTNRPSFKMLNTEVIENKINAWADIHDMFPHLNRKQYIKLEESVKCKIYKGRSKKRKDFCQNE